MKKSQAITLAFIVLFILVFITLWLFEDKVKIWGDMGSKDSYENAKFGWFHIGINVLAICSIITMVILLISETDSDCAYLSFLYKKEDQNQYEKEEKSNLNWNWKKIIKYGILIIIVIYLFGFIKNISKDNIKLYNTSKKYHNAYIQKIQEKMGFYDKLWKTYLQKDKITNINKETFILVTQIIMENRRDGEKLTWKWVQENQQIPYKEFTKFYADLSDFITSQREGYFNIEKECQTIANRNNTMLDTFPNNVYNKILKLERINFQYGFLSDSTINIFKSKKENIQ
ncbi:MAG: hypothetical protein PHF86_01110 [Candidatus Nanoarchaeia archaeon]|nr:hypothetical protein [Candidatus Nanoarchaeia archaeon]